MTEIDQKAAALKAALEAFKAANQRVDELKYQSRYAVQACNEAQDALRAARNAFDNAVYDHYGMSEAE